MNKIMTIIAGLGLCSGLSGCIYCKLPCIPAYPGPSTAGQPRNAEPYNYSPNDPAKSGASFPTDSEGGDKYNWSYWRRDGLAYDDHWGYYHNYDSK